MRPIRMVLALASVALGAVACTTYAPPRGWRADADALQARNEARQHLCPRMAAEGRLAARAGLLSVDARAIVLTEAPGRLRLEVLSPTDDLLAIATADEGALVYWERGATECFVGAPCREHVGRLLGVPLEVAELTALLTAAPPSRDARAGWDRSAGLETLAWRPSEQTEATLGFDPRTRRPREWNLSRRGRRVAVARWEDWRDDGDIDVPQRVTVRWVEGGAQLTWRYDVIDRDLDAGPPAYRFECPAGVRVVSLGPCETR